MTTLTINRGISQIFFDTDWQGRVVPYEKAKITKVCVRNELHTDHGKLAFHAIVRVSKELASENADAERLAISWLKAELPRRFAQTSYWNFFEYTELDMNVLAPDSIDESSKESTTTLELSSRIAEIAEETALYLADLRSRFDSSARRLSDLTSNNLPLGFAQTLGEARTLIRTIENVLSASGDYPPDQAGEARLALTSYQELARRKVESNHNYQSALTSLKRFAYGLHFPETWTRRPYA